MKYQIIVDCDFLDSWINKFDKWKAHAKDDDFNTDVEFLTSLIDNFLLTTDHKRVVIGKYNAFEAQVYNGYINYLKNQIYKLLPLLEERGEWRKHLDTIINEITGADKIFLHTISFITLISKLETLKQCPDLKTDMTREELKKNDDFMFFRKTIFESMNIAENLTLAGEHSHE